MAGPTSATSSTARKGMRRRLRLFAVGMICFLGWAGLTVIEQMDKLEANMERLTVMEGKLAETQQLNQAYKQEVERLNDPEYLEQLIRKDLHMTKEGETLFIEAE